MISKESKLTKYTLIACVLLFVAYFSTNARSEESLTAEEQITVIASTCSAVNGIAAEVMDEGMLQDAIAAEGVWWMAFLANWIGSEPVAAQSVTTVVVAIQDAYNRGDLTWDDLIKTAQVTCSQAKKDLVEAAED